LSNWDGIAYARSAVARVTSEAKCIVVGC
jgi:hypothetical protein